MRKVYSIMATIAIASVAVSCTKSEKATVAEAVRVKTIAASASDVASARSYSGTVEESSGVAISFPVAGTLERLNVSQGDRVSKGQLIGVLDATSLQHAYDIAKATLDEAQDAYNRIRQLHEANSVADMKWVEVQNALKQAQSAEAIARKALSDASLYAPASGYVSEKFADAGMTVAPGVPIVKIVDINPVKVNVSVPENEIGSFATGQTAQVSLGALGEGTFTGRLVEKGVSANPLTRSYSVKYQVENPRGELLPGMICDVVPQDAAQESTALVLPTGAVLLDADNQNFVWLAIDGRASKRVVTVGGLTDTGIIITGGIEAGDSVIVAGQQKVSRGTKIVSINK